MNPSIITVREKRSGAAHFYLRSEAEGSVKLWRLLPDRRDELQPCSHLEEARSRLETLHPDSISFVVQVAEEGQFLNVTPILGKSYIVQGQKRGGEQGYHPSKCVLAGPCDGDWAANYIATRSKVHHPQWRDPSVWTCPSPAQES